MGRNSKQGGGLPACACVCTCLAVTAATCHLFHFKAAGVTQVLWRRGQERHRVPRGASSLPVREEAADGRRQRGEDVPSSLSRVSSERGSRVAQKNRRVFRVGWDDLGCLGGR